MGQVIPVWAILAEKAARLYCRANAPHLNELRTYVKRFWRMELPQNKTDCARLPVPSGVNS